MKVDGVCALVTGSARGIGKALVERLLSKGAKFVAVIDINRELGEETVKNFKQTYGSERVRFIHCDVASERQLEKAFEESYSVNDRLDVVINNAGVVNGPNVLRVNLEAVVRSSYLAKKYMSKQNGGSGGVLINMSSVAGFIAGWDPTYTASKHGVKGFSLALTDDIRVGVICPGFVETNLIDNHPDKEAIKKTSWAIPMSQVVDAFVMMIEDDTKHGCCVRITKGKGIDLLPMKTFSEWASELQLFKT